MPLRKNTPRITFGHFACRQFDAAPCGGRLLAHGLHTTAAVLRNEIPESARSRWPGFQPPPRPLSGADSACGPERFRNGGPSAPANHRLIIMYCAARQPAVKSGSGFPPRRSCESSACGERPQPNGTAAPATYAPDKSKAAPNGARTMPRRENGDPCTSGPATHERPSIAKVLRPVSGGSFAVSHRPVGYKKTKNFVNYGK